MDLRDSRHHRLQEPVVAISMLEGGSLPTGELVSGTIGFAGFTAMLGEPKTIALGSTVIGLDFTGGHGPPIKSDGTDQSQPRARALESFALTPLNASSVA